jgi:hypothetical protein
MSTTVEATYDGQVFRPTKLVPLEPNTKVRLTIESLSRDDSGPVAQDYPEADFYTPVTFNWVDDLYTVDQALVTFGGQSHAHR